MQKRKKNPSDPLVARKLKQKQRQDKLNQWARGDAKSNVGQYKT